MLFRSKDSIKKRFLLCFLWDYSFNKWVEEQLLGLKCLRRNLIFLFHFSYYMIDSLSTTLVSFFSGGWVDSCYLIDSLSISLLLSFFSGGWVASCTWLKAWVSHSCWASFLVDGWGAVTWLTAWVSHSCWAFFCGCGGIGKQLLPDWQLEYLALAELLFWWMGGQKLAQLSKCSAHILLAVALSKDKKDCHIMHLTGIKKETFLGFESGYDRFPRYSSWIKMISSKYHALFWKLWTGVQYFPYMKGKCSREKKSRTNISTYFIVSAYLEC